MLVAEMTATQLYGLIMLAFVIVMLAGLGLREIPNWDGKQRVVAFIGYFAIVIGPALFGLSVLIR